MNARMICIVGTLILGSACEDMPVPHRAAGACAQNLDEVILVDDSNNPLVHSSYVVVDRGRLVSVCLEAHCYVDGYASGWAGELIPVPEESSFKMKVLQSYDAVVAGNSGIKREPVTSILLYYADQRLIRDKAIIRSALEAVPGKNNVVSLSTLRAVPNGFALDDCAYSRVIRVNGSTGKVLSVTETSGF